MFAFLFINTNRGHRPRRAPIHKLILFPAHQFYPCRSNTYSTKTPYTYIYIYIHMPTWTAWFKKKLVWESHLTSLNSPEKT